MDGEHPDQCADGRDVVFRDGAGGGPGDEPADGVYHVLLPGGPDEPDFLGDVPDRDGESGDDPIGDGAGHDARGVGCGADPDLRPDEFAVLDRDDVAGREVFIASGTVSSPTGQPATWTYATPANMFVGRNGNTFQVTARGRDLAQNTKATPGSADINFTVSATAATVLITQPAAPNDVNYKTGAASVGTFQGTATDLAPAGNNVQIRLQRLSDDKFWSESTQAYVASDTFTVVSANLVPASQPWTFSLSFPTATYVQDNTTYTLTINGVNYVGQVGAAASRRFVIDNPVPVGAISSPNTVFHRTVPALSGTANDPSNPTPPSFDAVDLRIKDPNGNYWNGTQFVAGVNEISAGFTYPGSGTAVDWSTSPALTLQDGGDYTILIEPHDKAGNSPANEGVMTSFVITFDTAPPTAEISDPTVGEVRTTLNTVSGTALDPAGEFFTGKKSDLQAVEISIQDITPGFGQFWSGTGFNVFSGTGYWVAATNTGDWTYTAAVLNDSLTSGHRYLALSRAYDNADNVQTLFGVGTSSVSFGVDRSSPTASITVPADGGAFQPSVLAGANAFTGTAVDGEASLYQAADALDSVEVVVWYLESGRRAPRAVP